MIYVFLAQGFEECEALSPVDILRRANIPVKTVGVKSKTVIGAHNIPVVCDIEDSEISFDNLEGIILPGGMPGTLNLEKSQTVQKAIDYANNNNLLLGAICAAPSILGHKGFLKGKKATCFTGFEKDLEDAIISQQPICRDGNIITAFGAGAALDFGFLIVSYFKGEDFAKNLAIQMRYKNKGE